MRSAHALQGLEVINIILDNSSWVVFTLERWKSYQLCIWLLTWYGVPYKMAAIYWGPHGGMTIREVRVIENTQRKYEIWGWQNQPIPLFDSSKFNGHTGCNFSEKSNSVINVWNNANFGLVCDQLKWARWVQNDWIV